VNDNLENYYAVILAGGGGTRLWPASRKAHPKHLLKLLGDKTLIQSTYDRLEGLVPEENIYIITNKSHAKEVGEQLPKIPSKNIIAEPSAKNTAMAMGAAAAVIHSRNPNASVVYLAADHVIKNEERFRMNALAALRVASSGDFIVAVGIKPEFPHIGLGYIKIGKELEDLSVVAKKGFVFKGIEFKEKPNLVTAQSFIASGQYLWNANLYCWSTVAIMKAFEEYSPEVYAAAKEIAEKAGKGDLDKLLEEVYGKLGSPDSIDYEVSEKVKNLVVIPGDFGWSDVGDWKVVFDLREKNMHGLAISGETDVVNIGSQNLLIDAGKKLVAVVGVEDLVIIDTGDTLLIAKNTATQDVKKVVEKLKEEDKKEYL
jgi:mannose-1-phosphate guanylyltransferase